MADPVTMAMMGLKVGQGLVGFGSSRKKSKEAKRQARAQARQLRREFRIIEGETRTRVGASGVRMQGTPQTYIQGMQQEHRRQVRAVRKYGSAQASSIRKQGIASLISGVGGAINTFGSSEWANQIARDSVDIGDPAIRSTLSGALAPIRNINMMGNPVNYSMMRPVSPGGMIG